jgi:hypothetical protein
VITDVSAVSAVRELAAQVDPDWVLLPGLAHNESLRIWNGAVDHRLRPRSGQPARG